MRITKRAVDAAGPGRHYDDNLAGFGLYVGPSGARSYFFEYRPGRGRGVAKRRMTIGKHGVLTPDDARKEAVRLAGIVAAGGDPLAERQRPGETVAEVAERYLAEHVAHRFKTKPAAEEARLLRAHVLPALGKRPIADVTRQDILRLHGSMRDTPTQANRALSVCARLFGFAERWGLRPENMLPTRRVARFAEARRERFLSADELARLGAVLAEAERSATESPAVVAAVRLLIFTGGRLGEILTLQWPHVDFEASCLRLADSKTGAKVVHLNAPAAAVLAALPRDDGSPWVIPGAKAGAHLVNLQKPWRRIRSKAGLDGVRLHDLRHSFASAAVRLGEGLPMIGKLLGHSQVQTTARYAHLAADPVKAATERVGAAIDGALRGATAEIVRLPPKR